MSMLERELADLQTMRVAARQVIERSWWLVSDFVDRERLIEHQRSVLRGSQRRWEELCHLLGKEHRLVGPISLALTPDEQRAAARPSLSRHTLYDNRRDLMTRDMSVAMTRAGICK